MWVTSVYVYYVPNTCFFYYEPESPVEISMYFSDISIGSYLAYFLGEYVKIIYSIE